MGQRHRPTVRRLLIGNVTLALALAGCGTMTMTSGSPAPRASGVSRALSPQQRAKADAASILAAFIPPPGARRLAGPPADVGGELDNREFMPLGDPDLTYDTSVWEVRGRSPLQVLAWEKAHLPSRFLLTEKSGATVSAPKLPRPPRMRTWPPRDPYQYASYGFDLPELPGILISREMVVQAARSLAGQTYVRVDAQVLWQPQRAASERVPAGVSVITITAQPDMNQPHDMPAPITVTDPAKVSKIVALADGLYVDSGGMRMCPLETGKGITLKFLGHVNGPVLATASEPIPSCGDVQFTVEGTREPPLEDFGSFAQQVLSIAGAQWNGYNLPAPVSTP